MPVALDDAPLRHTARSRLAAVVRGSRAEAARDADRRWLEHSADYAQALTAPLTAGALRCECDGLTFDIPPSEKPSRMTARLLNGSLPWHDILQQRGLGAGTVTLDIGANIGTTSLTRIVAGDAQRVYAAEPDPTNYLYLVHNIASNGLRGFVLPDAIAISSRDGEGYLKIARRIGNHQLVADGGSTSDAVAVRMLTLDRWVTEAAIEPELVSLVKLDVQGFEGHVLLGAARLLAERHVAWALEVSPKHLATAGTPLPEFCELAAKSFTHAIDCRRDPRPFQVARLAQRLAYLGEEESFTNVLFYSAPQDPA
jgi:FkbM family methyltransferase